MTDNYNALSRVYDRLNCDIDYEIWAKYIDKQIKENSKIPVSLVLDLCCGTGNMTFALDSLGYDMTGIDLSGDMLNMANDKARECGKSDEILFLCQSMLEFELYGTVQAVVSCLDSLNHVDQKSDLAKVFSLVHLYLESGGLFIFDLNTPYKFKNIYGTNAYVLEDEGIFCGWQNIYDSKSRICEFYTSIFTENKDGSYTRADDYEREYCFYTKEVLKMLEKSGFEIVSVHADFDGSPEEKTSERLYFTARRI